MLDDKVRNPIRIGIIGAGLWGEAHAHVFSSSNYARLTALCDFDLSKGKALGDVYGIPAFASVEEMLDAVELDAVSIATPDFAHTEPVIAAAKRGKHILVEKPLATTMDDVDAIETVVREAGVRLMVDFHARWSPRFTKR